MILLEKCFGEIRRRIKTNPEGDLIDPAVGFQQEGAGLFQSVGSEVIARRLTADAFQFALQTRPADVEDIGQRFYRKVFVGDMFFDSLVQFIQEVFVAFIGNDRRIGG